MKYLEIIPDFLSKYGVFTTQSTSQVRQEMSMRKFRLLISVCLLTTGVIQLIPPVLSSETFLHILLSSEYSGFHPSTTVTAVVTQTVHT